MARAAGPAFIYKNEFAGRARAQVAVLYSSDRGDVGDHGVHGDYLQTVNCELMLKAVRGTRDLLPPETETWNFVDAAARDLFRAYNFHEIRTPILEELTLFQR